MMSMCRVISCVVEEVVTINNNGQTHPLIGTKQITAVRDYRSPVFVAPSCRMVCLSSQ